jgi:hypothetical protein
LNENENSDSLEIYGENIFSLQSNSENSEIDNLDFDSVKDKFEEALKKYLENNNENKRTKFILIDLILNKSWGKTGADLFYDLYQETKRKNERDLIPLRFVPVIFISKHFTEYTVIQTMGKALGDWFLSTGKMINSYNSMYKKIQDVYFVFRFLENIKYYIYQMYLLLFFKLYFIKDSNKKSEMLKLINDKLKSINKEIILEYQIPEFLEYFYDQVVKEIYKELELLDKFGNNIPWKLLSDICTSIMSIIENNLEPYSRYLDLEYKKENKESDKNDEDNNISLRIKYTGIEIMENLPFSLREKKNELKKALNEIVKMMGLEKENNLNFYLIFEYLLEYIKRAAILKEE